MIDVTTQMRSRLTIAYGRAMPDDLHLFAAWSQPKDKQAAFERRFGWEITIPPTIYTNDPIETEAFLPFYDFSAPELLPVLGSFYAYGYLDLAPEIIAPNQMPLVAVNPKRERYPNAITAYTLSDLFATLLSNDDPDEPSLVEVFGHPVISSKEPTSDLKPYCPQNYRYLPDFTGSGVLAPIDAFNSFVPAMPSVHEHKQNEQIPRLVNEASRALRDGYPATAIACARTVRAAYPFLWSNDIDSLRDEAMDVWIRALKQLQRGRQAELIKKLRQTYNQNPRPYLDPQIPRRDIVQPQDPK